MAVDAQRQDRRALAAESEVPPDLLPPRAFLRLWRRLRIAAFFISFGYRPRTYEPSKPEGPPRSIFSPRPFDSFRYSFRNRTRRFGEKEIRDRLEPDFFCGGLGGVAAPMLATPLLKGSEPEEKDPLNCSLSSSGGSICPAVGQHLPCCRAACCPAYRVDAVLIPPPVVVMADFKKAIFLETASYGWRRFAASIERRLLFRPATYGHQ